MKELLERFLPPPLPHWGIDGRAAGPLPETGGNPFLALALAPLRMISMTSKPSREPNKSRVARSDAAHRGGDLDTSRRPSSPDHEHQREKIKPTRKRDRSLDKGTLMSPANDSFGANKDPPSSPAAARSTISHKNGAIYNTAGAEVPGLAISTTSSIIRNPKSNDPCVINPHIGASDASLPPVISLKDYISRAEKRNSSALNVQGSACRRQMLLTLIVDHRERSSRGGGAAASAGGPGGANATTDSSLYLEWVRTCIDRMGIRGVSVVPSQLPIGDYLCAQGTESPDSLPPALLPAIVERKTIADLAASIIDNRMASQRRAMAALGLPLSVLVVEGRLGGVGVAGSALPPDATRRVHSSMLSHSRRDGFVVLHCPQPGGCLRLVMAVARAASLAKTWSSIAICRRSIERVPVPAAPSAMIPQEGPGTSSALPALLQPLRALLHHLALKSVFPSMIGALSGCSGRIAGSIAAAVGNAATLGRLARRALAVSMADGPGCCGRENILDEVYFVRLIQLCTALSHKGMTEPEQERIKHSIREIVGALSSGLDDKQRETELLQSHNIPKRALTQGSKLALLIMRLFGTSEGNYLE